jgi:HPt (histidine-containing phosphotransfer) domain-containing protein
MKNYNLEPLKEQCGADKAFFNEMIDIFIKSSLEGIEKMEEAHVKNNLKEMGHYAHKIIAPCRHIEADNLIPMLKEIETRSDTKELEPELARFLINKIKLEAEELVKNLKTEYI